MSEKKDRLKTRTRISGTVENNIWSRFRILADETRIPKSKLMDEAFSDLLKKYGKSDKENVVN